MNGRYKVLLKEGEEPEANTVVKRLLRMFDPGAKWTIQVWNEPLSTMVYGDGWGGRKPARFGARYCEIKAEGGKARQVKPRAPSAPRAPALRLEKIERCLLKARKTLDGARRPIQEFLRRQWRDIRYGEDNTETRAAQREAMERQIAKSKLQKRLGQCIAKILSRHRYGVQASSAFTPTPQDYLDLSSCLDRRVESMSKVSKYQLDCRGGYLGWIIFTYAGSWRFGQRRTARASKPAPPRPIAGFLEAKAEAEYWEELYLLAIDRETK